VVVKVVASDGVPVPGVAVTFNTSGAASPATAMTDANGLAQTHWTLANTAGSQTLNVSAANVPTLAVQATATQAALTLVSGSGQSALTGHALAQPIVVQVANGTAGVSGVNVTFAVASGNGSVSPTTVATDATGRAQTTWTMGTAAGTETMTVTAAGAGGSLTVTANATVAPTISFVSVLPTAITTAGSSTIVALVTGTNGLPQSGALVTFTSSGTGNTISPATATTDVSGHATVLFSSTVAENKTITATANGVSAQVSLPVVAATTSAVTIVKVSGDGQTVHYGTSFGAPLVVRAMDANGSPVAGALIDWGTAAGNLRKVTDANGLSSNTYQLANDPIDFPAGIAAHITVTLVGTAAAVVFSYLPAP
jgi:adhesin/invasin